LYNLATNIADLPDSLGLRIANSVVYPTLSRTYNEARADFSKIYYRMRLYFDVAAHTSLGGLAAMSEWLVGVLYDERYHGASVMLGAFALRSAFALMAYPWETAFFASGVTHFQFRRSVVNSVSLLLLMPIGFSWLGPQGVIWGTVLARGTPLLVLWPAAHKAGWIRYHREALVPVFLGLGYALGRGAVYLLERLF
jgi:O-antigen/teichoic acid export membrane protein